MLCQFTIKNFKSIRDEMTLDMQAVAISEHKNHILHDSDNEKFLPLAVIYGPNGGGKSNVLEALHVLVAKVMNPVYLSKEDYQDIEIRTIGLRAIPFAFREDTKREPVEFILFFRTEIGEYRYILHILNERIVFEKLDLIKMETGRKSELFFRDKRNVELKGELGKLKISEGLSEAMPLLSYLGMTYSGNGVVRDVINWFAKKIKVIDYGNPHQEAKIKIAKSAESKKLIVKMLREMDLDIEDFRIEERGKDRIEIFTKHPGYNTELSLREESGGTKKLFGLLPHIIESILTGMTLVVDELDAKLHPLLLRYIINLFSDKNINKHNAQLIFTSHDLSTMNNEVFRRDEIWFVAKGKEQNSQLYSLVEFKNDKGVAVRKDAKYDKQYLEGRYGADPYLKIIIDWSDPNA